MNLTIIDFAPVIMAAVAVSVGFGFVKLLVYLHHKQDPRHGSKGGK